MAGDTEISSQADVDELIRQTLGGGIGSAKPDAGAVSPAPAPGKPGQGRSAPVAGGNPIAEDIQFLLEQTEQALASVANPTEPQLAGATPFAWREFNGSPPSADQATLELLRDVELEVRIELGRAEMYVEDVLKLRRGSVVPLDKLAGDPVDIYVNGRLVARGEILVMNDNFCVRVAELVTGDGRAA